MTPRLLLVAGILSVLPGCSAGHDSDDIPSYAGDDGANPSGFEPMLDQPTEPKELADGSYYCEATNVTRANGPYRLRCEKSGGSLVIHFRNGGRLTLSIDSEDSDDGRTWDLSGTNLNNGDVWEIMIND